MLDIYLQNKYVFTTTNSNKVEIDELIEEKLKLKNFYLIHNGKILKNESTISKNAILHIIPRTLGGKGGFGSMLRAIGAQIEKTTNREACRDLSGRRLRDINEEKRLKNWIDQQATREQEIILRKEEKIKRLSQKPKHEFKDENYDKERSELPERLEDAVTQGLSSSPSSSGLKRKLPGTSQQNKKRALWVDDGIDEDDISSSTDSEDEEKDTNVKNTSDKEEAKIEDKLDKEMENKSNGDKEKEDEKINDFDEKHESEDMEKKMNVVKPLAEKANPT